MNFKFLYTATALILLSHSTAASAEPSEHVKTLMNRPLSLLDWGIYKLKEHLNEHPDWANNRSPLMTYVTYDWEKDSIQAGFLFTEGASSYEEAVQICDAKYKVIDRSFLVSKGQDLSPGYCYVCSEFSHNGWTSPEVEKAQEKIKNKVSVNVQLNGYSCSRELYGTKVSVSQQP